MMGSMYFFHPQLFKLGNPTELHPKSTFSRVSTFPWPLSLLLPNPSLRMRWDPTWEPCPTSHPHFERCPTCHVHILHLYSWGHMHLHKHSLTNMHTHKHTTSTAIVWALRKSSHPLLSCSLSSYLSACALKSRQHILLILAVGRGFSDSSCDRGSSRTQPDATSDGKVSEWDACCENGPSSLIQMLSHVYL